MNIIHEGDYIMAGPLLTQLIVDANKQFPSTPIFITSNNISWDAIIQHVATSSIVRPRSYLRGTRSKSVVAGFLSNLKNTITTLRDAKPTVEAKAQFNFDLNEELTDLEGTLNVNKDTALVKALLASHIYVSKWRTHVMNNSQVVVAQQHLETPPGTAVTNTVADPTAPGQSENADAGSKGAPPAPENPQPEHSATGAAGNAASPTNSTLGHPRDTAANPGARPTAHNPAAQATPVAPATPPSPPAAKPPAKPPAAASAALVAAAAADAASQCVETALTKFADATSNQRKEPPAVASTARKKRRQRRRSGWKQTGGAAPVSGDHNTLFPQAASKGRKPLRQDGCGDFNVTPYMQSTNHGV